MGMASSDDETQILRDHAHKQWAKNAPKRPGTYERPATEEERAMYLHSLEAWAAEQPIHDPWENYGNR